jgi:hypothetical protein
MVRRFLILFCAVFFAGACFALESDVLDYKNIGPKEQAAGHMGRLTDPDGSVRRDGANLLSREIERVFPELGMSPGASAFLAEVGAGLSALLLTDSATVRVRAERVMDQLIAGYVSASTSKDAALKEEGQKGLLFLAQRLKEAETRTPIANALKKLKIEMPAFDEALAKQYVLPSTEAPGAPDEEESSAAQPEPAPAQTVQVSVSAPPAPVQSVIAEPVNEAPASIPPAAEAPKAAPTPRKIVVRSLAGGAAKPATPATPSSAQVITVSLKDIKKSGQPKTDAPAAAAPEKDTSSQDRVVLKMLGDKLSATDEAGKLVGLEFAIKLIDSLLKAKDSDEPDLKKLADDDLQAVRRLIGDPSPGVRAEAVRVAAAFKDTEAIPLLISRLGDQDPNVREAAHVALVSLTGKDLGPSPEKWQ